MAALCLFPTSRLDEHTDSSGNKVRTRRGAVCLAGDSVAASLGRYQDSPNVTDFQIEPSESGLIVHSVIRNPVSEGRYKGDF
jgi:hypothetical protein